MRGGTMDHIEAVNNQAVERYLLGEMPDAEIDAFEKHFFECGTCAAEVESGVLFQENARAAFQPVPQPASAAKRNWLSHWLSPRLSQWWTRPAFAAPALAAALLAAAVVYQAGFVIPALRQELARAQAPQAVVSLLLKSATRGPTRGEEKSFLIPAGAPSFLVQMDLDDTTFPQYQCALYDQSGALRWSLYSPAPPPGGQLNVVIPVAGLKPGVYTLKVHGMRGSQVGPEASYSIPLQFQ
jgi:anti-sigma factor RsiW